MLSSVWGVKARDDLINFRIGCSREDKLLECPHLLRLRQREGIKLVGGNGDTPIDAAEGLIEGRGIQEGSEGPQGEAWPAWDRADHIQMIFDNKTGVFEHEGIGNDRGDDSALLLFRRGALDEDAGLVVQQKILARLGFQVGEMRPPGGLEVEFAVSIDGFSPYNRQAAFFVRRTKLVFVAVPHQLAGGHLEAVISEPVGHVIEALDQGCLGRGAGEQPGSAGHAVESGAANPLDKQRLRRIVRAQEIDLDARLFIPRLPLEDGEGRFLQDTVEDTLTVADKIEALQRGLVGEEFAKILEVFSPKE
jgi:hypothetical protein